MLRDGLLANPCPASKHNAARVLEDAAREGFQMTHQRKMAKDAHNAGCIASLVYYRFVQKVACMRVCCTMLSSRVLDRQIAATTQS